MMLQDAPGGAAFIESLVRTIKMLALIYAGTPDAPALAHLRDFIASIQPTVAEAVGAGSTPTVLEGFEGAVMAEKHKIESGGASRA
jgi:hypothetical protein